MEKCSRELISKIVAEDNHINVDGLDIAIKSIPALKSSSVTNIISKFSAV